MPDEENKAGSITALVSSLAAATAVTSGFLFYIGYLFLRGFYRAFSIPIEMLELSAQDIIAESGTLLIPLLLFAVLYILIIRLIDRSATGIKFLFLKLKSTISIGAAAFVLILTLTIPPTGEWFAVRLVASRFTAYNFLAKPLPSIILHAKEPLSSLPADSVDNGIHIYRHLILVASNKDSYFLYKKNMGTYVVSKSDVSIVLSP